MRRFAFLFPGLVALVVCASAGVASSAMYVGAGGGAGGWTGWSCGGSGADGQSGGLSLSTDPERSFHQWRHDDGDGRRAWAYRHEGGRHHAGGQPAGGTTPQPAPLGGDPAAGGVVTLTDPQEGIFGSPSFDITAVSFQSDASWLSIDLQTAGPFVRTGGATAMPQATAFNFVLAGQYQFFLTTTATTATLTTPDGAVPADEWQAWTSLTDGHLQLRLSNSLLAGLDPSNFSFYGRLDNNDAAPDDVIQGQVAAPLPEPATLALLGIGGLFVAARRRNRS